MTCLIDFIRSKHPLCILSCGFAIIGYLGFRAVRWVINKCQRVKRVEAVASQALANQPLKQNEQKSKVEESPERAKLKESLIGKKVVVITRGMNGFGDYLCAKKICLYLHTVLDVPLQNIALSSPADERIRKILGLNCVMLKGDFDSLRTWDPDVRIATPVTDQFVVGPLIELNDVTPTLAIAEYGFKNNSILDPLSKYLKTLAFGFDDSSLGYIPTPALREFAKKKRMMTQLEKLQHLSSVPPEVSACILGQPYSQQALEAFAKGSKLYFGYAHHSSEVYSFIQGIAHMSFQLRDSSSLCFYIMGDSFEPPSALQLTALFNSPVQPFMEASGHANFREIQAFLEECGIGGIDVHCITDGRVESHSFRNPSLNLETAIQGDKVMQDFESGSFAMGVDHSQKVKATPIANDYGSKDCVNLSPSIAVSRLNRIKVIYGTIPSASPPYLDMASEEETLKTGDQSFSEGVSAEKCVVAEVFNHKKELDRQYLAAFPEELRTECDFYTEIPQGPVGKSLGKKIDPRKLSKFFLKRKRDKNFELLHQQTMARIARDFDFASRFDRELLRVMELTKGLKKQKVRVIKLPSTLIGSEAEFPFDTICFLSNEEAAKLVIGEDGLSLLDVYKDSKFRFKSLGNGYQILRQRK